MGKISDLEFKLFYYLAFISFALGVALAIPTLGLQKLLGIEPRSFAIFSALCILFAISHQLRKLTGKTD